MGGHTDDVWGENGVTLSKLAARNMNESGSQNNAFYKSYFNAMASHRESKIGQTGGSNIALI